MGSLIKSPGGTIVPGGGYVAGRADLVAAAAARLTAPGVGLDAGCVSGDTLRLMAQGLLPLCRAVPCRAVPCRAVPCQGRCILRHHISPWRAFCCRTQTPLVVWLRHILRADGMGLLQCHSREAGAVGSRRHLECQCDSGCGSRRCAAGLWLAPQMVGEALKGGRLVAAALSSRGYEVVPGPGRPRHASFITAVRLGSREKMVAFCAAVQRCCPVGSYVKPVPGGWVGVQEAHAGTTAWV
jgi:cystathionine beta-lyase family protein involved in aluminum resistance